MDYHLAIPGLGHFGPTLQNEETARDIAREVANTERRCVQINDAVSIVDLVEPEDTPE